METWETIGIAAYNSKGVVRMKLPQQIPAKDHEVSDVIFDDTLGDIHLRSKVDEIEGETAHLVWEEVCD